MLQFFLHFNIVIFGPDPTKFYIRDFLIQAKLNTCIMVCRTCALRCTFFMQYSTSTTKVEK